MLNILTITGPIYLVIALGFAATRRGLFSKLDGQVLGRFVLHFALPAMLFNTLTQRDFAEVMNPRYLIAYGVGSVFSFAVGFGLWRVWRKKSLTQSSLVAMGVSSANSGYVGYPILLQLLGPAAGVGLALTVLVENLVTIPLALAMAESGETAHLSWRHTVLQSLKRMAKIPMMQAIVLGFAFSILGWHLPEVLSKTVVVGETLAAEMEIEVVPVALSSNRTLSLEMKSVTVPPVTSFQLEAPPVEPVCQFPLSIPVHFGVSLVTLRFRAVPLRSLTSTPELRGLRVKVPPGNTPLPENEV